VSQKGTLSFLVMSLSFAPPKESNQRTEALKGRARERSEQKESGKDNRVCFSPIAQCHFRSKKQNPVRAFSGFALAPC